MGQIKYTLTIAFALFVPGNLIYAQKKIAFDINLGVEKSIGKNRVEQKSTQYVDYSYYRRERYQHFYNSLLMNAAYPVTSKLSLGLQSGIYMHYAEQYLSAAKRTTVGVPLQFTGKYKLGGKKQSIWGLNASAGAIFFSIKENDVAKYRNGLLFNTSIFYSYKYHLIKLGFEKQVDHVSFYTNTITPYENAIIKYHIVRNSLTLSYGIIIK